jgi:hypothetical protein
MTRSTTYIRDSSQDSLDRIFRLSSSQSPSRLSQFHLHHTIIDHRHFHNISVDSIFLLLLLVLVVAARATALFLILDSHVAKARRDIIILYKGTRDWDIWRWCRISCSTLPSPDEHETAGSVASQVRSLILSALLYRVWRWCSIRDYC